MIAESIVTIAGLTERRSSCVLVATEHTTAGRGRTWILCSDDILPQSVVLVASLLA